MIARAEKSSADDFSSREIAELRAELAALQQRVARLEQYASADTDAQRRAARAALPSLIASSAQGLAFTAAEVLKHRSSDERLTRALDAAGIRSARQLGRYLRSIAGQVLGHVCVERVGTDREGIVWLCKFAP